MEVFYDFKPGLIKQSALALGFFDGVHPGHQVVINKALEEAKRLKITPAVVTFTDHPRSLTTGSAPKLLTLVDQRLKLFEDLGIEAALALTFREEICKMSPQEYVQKVLLDAMGAKSISVGVNHRFGRNREGSAELLMELGKEHNFVVHQAQMIRKDNLEVSSSAIRQAVSEGHMQLAEKLLGRPHAIMAKVIRGDQRGRLLGFPTANLSVSAIQVIPPTGVYAGFYQMEDSKQPAVINIGYRPTVVSDNKLTIEAHILDFNKDLYDKTVSFELCHRLRDEMKFNGIEELKAQIQKDCDAARLLLITKCK